MKKWNVQVWVNRTTSYSVEIEAEDKEAADEAAMDAVNDGGKGVTEGDTDTMNMGVYDDTKEVI